MAATAPKPNTEFHIDSSTWNDEDVEAAWKPGPYKPERAWAVYGASKVQAEQACFGFMKEKKPGFVFNSVIPDTVMGEISIQGSQGQPPRSSELHGKDRR